MPPKKVIELARSCVDAGVIFRSSISDKAEDNVSVQLRSDDKIVNSEYSRIWKTTGQPIISSVCTRNPKNKRILKLCRVLYLGKDKGCAVSAEVFPEDVLSKESQDWHRR